MNETIVSEKQILSDDGVVLATMRLHGDNPKRYYVTAQYPNSHGGFNGVEIVHDLTETGAEDVATDVARCIGMIREAIGRYKNDDKFVGFDGHVRTASEIKGMGP